MPNFSQSKLFNSEIFMKEFIECVCLVRGVVDQGQQRSSHFHWTNFSSLPCSLQQDLQQLIVMMHKFADFDLEGKKIFVVR